MQPITMEEVVDIAQYERIRKEFRDKVMAVKDRRRVRVGPALTFLFENRLTVLYQVQEMMRAERMVAPEAIRYEVETYNELLPEPGGLGASLLIEYPEPEERNHRLREMLGLDRHVWLRVGELPPIRGAFDTRQIGEEKLSSVQYLRFALTPEHHEVWAAAGDRGKIRIVTDHPAYAHESTLTPAQAQALQEDFTA
ncbi:MAG: DUF3501 family protein [Deltaproteobacteria bacterium]|nr:DUF3501 family protein [Deltaproteobacteria bacterium]